MPLQKLMLKSGVNKENTRYTTEGGWYDCDKVRFRQGTPEVIGGYSRISSSTYLGVCRSLWDWDTLSGRTLTGVGTSKKFYLEQGGGYNDITPIRSTVTLNNPFSTVLDSSVVTVADVAHGSLDGDFVTFSGSTDVGGIPMNREFEITVIDDDSYTVTSNVTATSTVSGGGGVSVTAQYQINIGGDYVLPLQGWGANFWGYGAWGEGLPSLKPLRLWSQANFGQDLVFGPRGGALYYWSQPGVTVDRGVAVSSLPGASDVPLAQNLILVSDVSRFTIVFGTNDIGSTDVEPMLVRWADQESVTDWTPAITNQAGSILLSHGSAIIAVAQDRQAILIWTDTSLYSMQYVGPPYVWNPQLMADSISTASQNCAVIASGVAYWMGIGKFYKYDGRVQTLRCDLRQHIFQDFNTDQYAQVFAGTNEEFNEVWWFYCSSGSTTVDRYAIYNYGEDVWYYGNMARTAWLDSNLRSRPIAATYSQNLVYHEYGVDDNESGTPAPIAAHITSSEFDIGDGHNFSFIWRILPDITFRGSTSGTTPRATMTLYPLKNSGSGYTNPASVGGTNSGVITEGVALPVEQFTGQIYTRIRGRQVSLKIESSQIGTTWQLGSPRLDIRADGRR